MNYKILSTLVLLAGWSLSGIAQASMEDGQQPVVVSQQPTHVAEHAQKSSLRIGKEKQEHTTAAQRLYQRQVKQVGSTNIAARVQAQESKQVRSSERPRTKTPVRPSNTTGKYSFGGVDLPDDYKSMSIFGRPQATQQQASNLIRAVNPRPKLNCSVEEIVRFYWLEAGKVGLRPDIALAQALVETGYFAYGGEVKPDQNNFCGLGTTGKGVPGASFKTPQLGVRAHLQHLLAYATVAVAAPDLVDPRYELARDIRLRKGKIDTWYGLNGTWATGSHYAEKIMAAYQNMLTQADASGIVQPSKPFDPNTLDKHERKRYEKLIKERSKLEKKLAKEEVKRSKLDASYQKKLQKQLAKEKALREQIAELLREEEAMKR